MRHVLFFPVRPTLPRTRVAAAAALFCVAASLHGVHAAADADPAHRARLAALSGAWISTSAEDWGRGAFGTREFTFENGRWSLRFVLALDRGMTQPVFEFRTAGTYRVGAPSAAVPGAFEALFLEDRKWVTLRTSDPGLAAAFGLAACGLVPGVEKDISIDGCASWKPVAVCREDHDLLALDTDGGLRFGVRPPDNDMCRAERRPRALLPAVVRR
jgi:hypothetical protein